MTNTIRCLSFKCFGLLRRFRPSPKAYAVLLYHQIINESENRRSLISNECIAVDSFRLQMQYIKNSCVVISLNELFHRIEKAIPPDRFYVVVTFDDGYRNNLDIAFPILRELRIPATFFLTTKFIDQKLIPWWDQWLCKINETNRIVNLKLAPYCSGRYDLSKWGEKKRLFSTIAEAMNSHPKHSKEVMSIINQISNNEPFPRFYMNWNEAKWLSRQEGVSIGAHSVHHEKLASVKLPLYEDILPSKNSIEKNLGQNIIFYAYPFGTRNQISESVCKEVEKAGFQGGFTAVAGFNNPGDDLFRLNRIPVVGNESFGTFLTRLYAADWLGSIKNRVEKRKGMISV